MNAPLLSAMVLLGSASFLLGCHGSVHGHVGPIHPPPPPPPPVFGEGEPNDTAWLAPWFGTLDPGDLVYIDGHATDDGSDPQDGLAFTVAGPARIDFTLFVDDPWTDLDVWLFDPGLNQFVAGFTTSFGDEKGSFWLAGAQEFHLVVFPAFGSSWWTLAVESSSTYGAAALAASALPPLPDALEGYATPARADAAPDGPDPAPRAPIR